MDDNGIKKILEKLRDIVENGLCFDLKHDDAIALNDFINNNIALTDIVINLCDDVFLNVKRSKRGEVSRNAIRKLLREDSPENKVT